MEKFLIKKLILDLSLVLLSILLIPFFLLSPLFLFLPLFLWRSLIGHLGGWLDPKKLYLMSARNSVVAIDDLWTCPEQSIVVTIGLSGHIDFADMFTRYAAIFLEKENLYPELRKYYEPWGGYLFWKEDEKFDPKNHYKLYKNGQNDTVVTQEEMEQFCLHLVKEPFTPERSPWEVIQVNNFKKDSMDPGLSSSSLLIFHVHHGLCDGFSILQFFTNLVDQWDTTRTQLPTANWSKGALKPTIWHYIVMTLLAPFNLVRQGLFTFDVNRFRLSGRKLSKKFWTSQIQLPIQNVKDIKDQWGVTFSAIVYAAIAGGFRNYMVDQGMDQGRIPQVFHMGLPFPWPHRSDKGMQNNMCVCIAKLPLGPSDHRERVRLCEKYWLQVKRSTVPLMNWTLMPLMGLFPDFLVKFLVRNNLTTIVLSNFPGPSEPLHIVGTEDVTTAGGIDFVTGLWRGNCGIGIGLISCNGIFKINIGVDQALLSSKEEVVKIKNFIENELNILSLGPKNEEEEAQV